MHHTLIVVCFVCATLSTFAIEMYDGDVSAKCMHNCYKNRTDFGDICSSDELECHQQCEYGCHRWKESLSNSCQLVCNSTNGSLTAKQIYCLIGCNDGVAIFRDKMQSHLGTPPPPVLVADSLTSTSLQLEWKYEKSVVPGLKFLIQWRYEEMQSSWQFYRKTNGMSKDSIFTVDDLQPYTKYRFRVAILIYQLSEPVFSTSSVIIMTLPEGAPRSSPSSVRAVPVDCTRISVSWESGDFPNGPILSYVVGLTELNTNISSFKDVPVEKNFDILSSLKPGSQYNVSVSLMNSNGIGPAAFASVMTPVETTVKDTQGPVLIIGTDREIVEQGVEIMDEPINLYNTEVGVTIKGVAIHVKYKLLFISDSNRCIYKMPLSKEANSRRVPIVLPSQINFQPLDLTVDWLNEQLYILVERNYQVDSHPKMWSIMKCGLDGEGLTVAVGGLTIKPHHIEVDPYNGYLFWILDERDKSNLYKLDLSDISNGIKHENHPEMIFSDKNLGAFIVDHTNFMLLVSNQNNKTVNSVSLDGKEVHDVRPKISNSILQKVISLATANKKFYWTDGNQVFCEEYHEGDQIYFHNSFSALMKASYLKVIINMPSSQPVPVPVNPPTQIQAIFASSRAKTTWNVPHLLGGQGKGAWQNWSYELSVKNSRTNITQTYRDVNFTSFTVGNLSHDTEYVVRAAAYTSSGKGPWSSEFRGRTLKHLKNVNHPVILWSASNGLSKSDVIGENIEILIDTSRLKSSYIMDSAWYRDEIYLLTNISEIFVYNLTSRYERQLPKLDNGIKSIAIDWIGRKLYWSKQQWIMRGSLSGGNKDPQIPATATELVIDSLRAYIYWSTGFAITCSRLNGDTKTIDYYANKEFSGQRVMGLTLDTDNKYLYWIVRGSEGSNLFRGPLAGSQKTNELSKIVSSLPKADIKGSLTYFNNRFLWLQDDDNAIISNLEGRNVAVITGDGLSALNMVNILDPALHQLSSKLELTLDILNVIPDSVDYDSIKVAGVWDWFNITWKTVDNVNFGIVLYEIKFPGEDITKIVDHPTIRYPFQVSPFSEISVSIRAFTYWASASAIKAYLHSPSFAPSEPRNLRAYVTYNRNFGDLLDIKVTLRWDKPIHSNGVIVRYNVLGWMHRDTDESEDTLVVCKDYTLAENREYVLNNLFKHKVYYFEVQAYTDSEGLPAKIDVNTTVENPIPTLIVASDDSIYREDLDVNKTTLLLHGISTPLEVAVLMRENKLFWLNDMQELFMYDMNSNAKSKIIDMNSNVISLTVDWLERSLYYIQVKSDIEGSSVYKLDLNLVEKNILKPTHVFRTPSSISRIEVSPFTKKLYWIETDQNARNLIMECSTNGSSIRPFFNRLEEPECQCPMISSIEKVLAVDHSNKKSRPSLIFIESSTSSITSADQHGCNCTHIINFEMSSANASLKSDLSHLHWLDSLEKVLHSFERRSGVLKKGSTNAREILIYGDHVQPYPPKKCLMPELHKHMSVSLVNRTSSSLTLGMPDVEILDECKNISFATIEYRIYYMPYNDDDQCDKSCALAMTFDKTVTIKGLRPYSKYVFSLQVSNYYLGLEENDDTILIGQGKVFQTAVGAPSEPRNVTITILNPTLLKVSWLPPEEFNGDTIYYEIHWQTEATTSGRRQKGEQKVMENDISAGQEPFTTILKKMTQNETYVIWVRAYSKNNESLNDSSSVKVTTFPEPDNITLTNYTAYSLSLEWNISDYVKTYSMQFTLLTSNDWQDVPADNIDYYNVSIDVNIENLKPKTQYKFRFLLQYPENDRDYIWPQDARFTFETNGDRPTPPGRPEIRLVNGNESKIWWQPSRDNGSPIQLYKLEGLKLRNYRQKRSTNRTAWFNTAPSIEEEIFDWEEFYNGTDTYWKVEGLNDEFRYTFRASALNEYGWSDPSEDVEFDPATAAELAGRQNPLHMILIAIVVPVLFSLLVILMCWACCRWNCSKNKKDAHIIAPIGRPDVELATLRELPRRTNFVHNTNVLYVSAQPTPEDIKQLPHIRRDQITLTQFLGSGAFGEVYEGIARGVAGNTTEIKVAVKTLRKGASDPEKTEFLQEAQLMSHFKHKHILQLLGVCLDNDPHYIIMELMEGGDLLTYLRSSRNTSNQTYTPPLTLVDLLKMCVDVTTGCRYLEEMHFVHRDLACRNCLVSSTDPETRIVKIGDFGLARDIYKNDYYRKEGEGLLPVRWMAPESLVDGVFTSQSDVWSFGVLLWEIMTLGQQPYPARNNFEVLHYVRRGGRLGKPTDCPEKLHELLLMCWSFEPERRPTFKYCLDTLTKLHEQVLRSPVTGAHNGQYISTVPEHLEGISNLLYFEDLNHNHSGTSWTSSDSSKEQTPFLNTANSDVDGPKYLEVVHDGNSEENDGYEVPRNALLSGEVEETNEWAETSGRDNVALSIESTTKNQNIS